MRSKQGRIRDSQEHYAEFVAQVASEDNISVEQLEKELNQYI